MSGRLASFRGPSTPTSSPVQQAKQSTATPHSPSRLAESTYHRKVRSLLLEIRAVTETWESIVLVDGLKAAKSLVDTRTELEFVVPLKILYLRRGFDVIIHRNELSLLPAGAQPRHHVVQPKLAIMDKRIKELDQVIVKLVRLFSTFVCPTNSVDWALVAKTISAHEYPGRTARGIISRDTQKQRAAECTRTSVVNLVVGEVR